MQWHNIKEKSAGKKRLALSYFLYKIFGVKILRIIAFGVSFFTFVSSPDLRRYSKNYLEIIHKIIGIKPNALNSFRHVYSYADSLVDKLIVFTGNFNTENIVYEDENQKKSFFDDINAKKGVFLICSHIGNIEVLQSFLFDKKEKNNFETNIIMTNSQCEIFNGFLNTIKREIPVKTYSAETLDLNSGIELKESLDKGNLLFIAGDRIARTNESQTIEQTMFNRKIYLPKGTFKLAKIMKSPIYFVSAVKKDGKYIVYMQKQTNTNETELTDSFVKFSEEVTKKHPLQFFHFYDFFGE